MGCCYGRDPFSKPGSLGPLPRLCGALLLRLLQADACRRDRNATRREGKPGEHGGWLFFGHYPKRFIFGILKDPTCDSMILGIFSLAAILFRVARPIRLDSLDVCGKNGEFIGHGAGGRERDTAWVCLNAPSASSATCGRRVLWPI